MIVSIDREVLHYDEKDGVEDPTTWFDMLAPRTARPTSIGIRPPCPLAARAAPRA